MSPRVLILTLGLAVLPACATAPQAPAPEAPTEVGAATTAAAKPKTDDGLVCRMETTIGSNRMKRVCRAASDIEDTARKTQDQVRRMQRTGGRAGDGE